MRRLIKQATLMDIDFVEEFPKDRKFNVIVDAFFGFSFKPPIREPFGQILSHVVESRIPVFSIDIPSGRFFQQLGGLNTTLGWDVENGPMKNVPNIEPEALISLTAPKKCAQHFKGKHHFLGGRFVPKKLAEKYALDLPDYPGSQQFVRL